MPNNPNRSNGQPLYPLSGDDFMKFVKYLAREIDSMKEFYLHNGDRNSAFVVEQVYTNIVGRLWPDPWLALLSYLDAPGVPADPHPQ